MLLGAIEGGGTKFICAVGTIDGKINEKITIPTTTPEETLDLAARFFDGKGISALGIGTFGPIEVNPKNARYGSVNDTPKPYWSDFSIVSFLQERLSVPISFETDVNAAVLGEVTWGDAKELNNCMYITVGTGIGAGAIMNNEFIYGLSHSEMGHILVRKNENDAFIGRCPFHNDCLEGLASGPAIEERWNKKAFELDENHQAWEFQSDYLAQAIMNYMLILSPERVIIGGGVMNQAHLFPMIRGKIKKLINGYIKHPLLGNDLEQYIVPPSLKENVGICGALALAKRALNN